MKRLAIKAIDYYRKLSQFFNPCCRFYPSCSQYLRNAIEKYGLIKGSRLGIFRLLRCNQLFPGGFDPLI